MGALSILRLFPKPVQIDYVQVITWVFSSMRNCGIRAYLLSNAYYTSRCLRVTLGSYHTKIGGCGSRQPPSAWPLNSTPHHLLSVTLARLLNLIMT